MVDISATRSHKIALNMHHSPNKQMIVGMMLVHEVHVVGRPDSVLFSPLKHLQHLHDGRASLKHVLNSLI